MITAKEARDLSDNLQTQKAKECLEAIEERIRREAAKGNINVNIVDLNPLDAVLTHLETIGYTVKKIKSDQYDTVLGIVISW